MFPSMPPYGSPNPYANPYAARAEAERANVNATPYAGAGGPPPNIPITPYAPPYPNGHTSLPPAPPRTAPSGRLANRFKGITMHQQPSANAAVSGYQPPFSQPQNSAPPQPSACGQYPESYMSPGQDFAHATSPMMGYHGGPQVTLQPADQFPSMSSLQGTLTQHPSSEQNGSSQAPQRPEFLIIGLFALRITKRLMQQLDPYEGQISDLRWLDNFLRPYHPGDALAKLTDPFVIEEYVREYPTMVRKMIKQPQYRKIFMEMDPDKKVTHRELTDEELLAIIDFADAAGEWGSVVPLPGKYAQKMEELAKGRCMAD